jgi:hypothetical protein
VSANELRQAGVFWLDAAAGRGGQPVMLTRLHLRYTRDSLPEDLVFQETADRQNFQARYVLRHPWRGDTASRDAAAVYFDEVARRQQREATTLASLTGWDVDAIRARMALAPQTASHWWESLWK